MKIDFHIHTYHSYDSLMKPEKILHLARQRGLDGIVITDHNTIAGGLEAREKNIFDDFHVIVGSEIRTDAGDVTGIFLEKEIQSRDFKEVCHEIKAQGGMTILNHPYVDHDLSKVNFDLIDFIEGYNARCPKQLNMKALTLAKEKMKPITAGSDAHLYSEIANAHTTIQDIDQFKPLDHSINYNKVYEQTLSQLIKAYKTKNPRIALDASIYLMKKLIFGIQ